MHLSATKLPAFDRFCFTNLRKLLSVNYWRPPLLICTPLNYLLLPHLDPVVFGEQKNNGIGISLASAERRSIHGVSSLQELLKLRQLIRIKWWPFKVFLIGRFNSLMWSTSQRRGYCSDMFVFLTSLTPVWCSFSYALIAYHRTGVISLRNFNEHILH